MEQRILSKDEVKSTYNGLASGYDFSVMLFNVLGFRVQKYRKEAIKSLNLSPGDTVVDLGCGTGLNFKLLQDEIGSEGRIIGVDLTGNMLKQARMRAKKNGWENVTLIQSDMADYPIPENVDGVLSTLAITMSPEYDNIIQDVKKRLRPGKRFSIFELKKPEGWPDWLVKAMIFLLKSYGTRYAHTKREPYKSLERYFKKFEMKEYYFGSVCIASGIA